MNEKVSFNLNSGLAGLSLLSGSNSYASFGSYVPAVETLAVRKAKAAFTAPDATPPWKQEQSTSPISVQASAIRRMSSIVDKKLTGTQALNDDVAAAFTSYKALDRLRVLAEAAIAGPTSSVRETLQSVFSKGMTDLQDFLSTAPGEQLSLAFDQPSRTAKSVEILKAGTVGETLAKGVAEARDAPLAGVSGAEQFSITIKRGTASDTVSVDLSAGPQPPTLDSVSQAFNDAIEAVPLRNPDGSVNLDENGNPVPRWLVRFVPDKSTGSWGFRIDTPGLEEVSIDQVGAKDALMIATGLSAADEVASTQIMRLVDPAGAAERQTLGRIAALDPLATERAELNAPKYAPIEGVEAPSTDRFAPTAAKAIATGPDGSSYVVGTASGEFGSQRITGTEDMFLTKLDSEGNVLWQRTLGSTRSASGAAISVGSDGQVVVAGTVTGPIDGDNADGDMLVARFDANGDEVSSTLVRTLGADTASAVTIGADGSIFVGGQTSSGSGDGFIARLDADGNLRERRRIDSGGTDRVTALAVDANGDLLALTREGSNAAVRKLSAASLATDLGQYSLGAADARAIAVGPDGSIAVGGATSAALNGTSGNSISGGRDGFVARLGADLSSADISYVGTGADDQIDSLTFMNGELYAGGRTKGDLAKARSGVTDGFVTRLDATTGAVLSNQQFGLSGTQAAPVQIAAAAGGSTSLGALGLHRGTISDHSSVRLTAQTSLRAGDQFSLRLNDGAVRRITIDAEETMTSLSAKVSKITGDKATITTPTGSDGQALSISAKPGNSIELIAGSDGRDALEKLGLPAARLVAAPAYDEKAPKVAPGGSYGLDLTQALDISTKEGATVALKRVKSAISMTQTAFRSLYWDSNKATIVNGGSSAAGGSVSAYQQAQIARYQDALTRISSLTVGFNMGGGGLF